MPPRPLLEIQEEEEEEDDNFQQTSEDPSEEQLAAQQAEITELKKLVRSLSGKDMAAEPDIE